MPIDTGNPIRDWINNTIYGSGGFNDYVEHELPVIEDRDFSLLAFAIRSLANPECEGSDKIVDLILRARKVDSGNKGSRSVFKSQGGEFPGWCKNCGSRRTLHRNHPGQEDGDPEWCY